MTIRVECYAGYRGDQEPLAFWLGERRFAVRGVVDQWFAPMRRWFKVDADDGRMYVLRHDEATGDWELAALVGEAQESFAPLPYQYLPSGPFVDLLRGAASWRKTSYSDCLARNGR